MGCPTGISGKFGRVLVDSCNITELTSWDLDYGSDPQVYNPASAGGAVAAVAGVEGGTGSFAFAKSANDQAVFGTGDCVQLSLYHNVAGTQKATGYALLGRFGYGADLGGAVQMVTVSFQTVNAWVFT